MGDIINFQDELNKRNKISYRVVDLSSIYKKQPMNKKGINGFITFIAPYSSNKFLGMLLKIS